MTELIKQYQEKFTNAAPEDVLTWFLETYTGETAFSTSLGLEDQVITHMIVSGGLPCRMFTLDTGRLFQECYDLIEVTGKKYNLDLFICFPDKEEVQSMVNKKGINLFYESTENRRLCCSIRKTEPLKRALNGIKVWITGLRKDQSVTRTSVEMIEWDTKYNLIKLNPLINWTEKEVWNYIRNHHIPYNTLHDKGYPSIGCAPCTRAVAPGEDIRAGRWWWELPSHKECGLHK